MDVLACCQLLLYRACSLIRHLTRMWPAANMLDRLSICVCVCAVKLVSITLESLDIETWFWCRYIFRMSIVKVMVKVIQA